MLNVEAMSSTDDLIDTLEFHEQANAAIGRQLIRKNHLDENYVEEKEETFTEKLTHESVPGTN